MGKSNKFDFSNRPTIGIKLGNSIASTFIKDAEKVQKDAVKAVERSRKASIGSSSGSVSGHAESEDHHLAHHVDLQAPSKKLGDDGLSALAEGLEQALRKGTEVASLRLEELNLSSNGLTTASLARLAPIIELAKHDLKTLNLFNNSIVVATDEEATQWTTFLQSFRHCTKLRRLDLSNNTELSARGMEIFARVHVREESATVPNDVSPMEQLNNGHELAPVQLLRQRQGLRGIPYIVLHQIGLTDAGALWLSYVLEDHHLPEQLIGDLAAVNAAPSHSSSRQSTMTRGIDWDSSLLGKDGLFLLQKADAVRKQRQDPEAEVAASESSEALQVESEGPVRRRSMERRSSRALPGNRRVSLRSSISGDDGDHHMSDLDSARKKIQRHLIEQDMRQAKSSSIDLWRAALEVVRFSRMLFIISPDTDINFSRQLFTGDAVFRLPSTAPSAPQSPTHVTPRTNGHAKKLSIDTARASSARGSYAAKLVAIPGTPTESASIAITEVTNTPTTPRMVLKPHRKGAFSEGTDIPAVTEKLNCLIVRDDSPQRFIKRQIDRINEHGKTAFRDRDTPTQLSAALMDNILGFAFGEVPFTVLSERQRRAAVAWGQDRERLIFKQEYRGKDESFKMWVMLNEIGCLAYGK